ncbi:MAG: S41 family peptidase [Spirochaetia bacterium]
MASPSLSQSSFTLQQLSSDFTYFKTVVNVINPLAYADRAALKAIMDDQETKLRDGMGEFELYRLLAPIVSAIQCGHSSINLPRGYDDFLREHGRYLPFLVRVIGASLFVLDPLVVQDLPAGAEITRINGRTSKEILNLLLAGLSSDGGILSRKYFVLNGWFNDQYLMLVESPAQFTVEFIDPRDGAAHSITTDAASKEALEDQSQKAGRPYAGPALPAYESSFASPDTAVLTVRSFAIVTADWLQDFRKFLGTFFNTLRDQGTRNLVLDLRGNWGGDPYASSTLYAYLIREPSPYFGEGTRYYPTLVQPMQPEASAFRGALYVLTNGASFSSTGHLCSLLRFHQLATFIGEETGGSFSCTDGSRDYELPETKLVFRSSTQEYHAAVTGFTPGRGIIPDYPVAPTLQDMLRGRDVQMDFALHLIGGGV